MKVFIILWRTTDLVDCGIVQVFSELKDAERLLDILEAQGKNTYDLYEREVL